MAKKYNTKDFETFLALSDLEKKQIYVLGSEVIKQVAELEKTNQLPHGWNKHDANALTIPLLCQPLEEGGAFIDLMEQQIDKYNKALEKIYGSDFYDIFEIEIEDGKLNKDEVFERMEHHRKLKRDFERKKLEDKKAMLSINTKLFEW